jgi:hypothetical protein
MVAEAMRKYWMPIRYDRAGWSQPMYVGPRAGYQKTKRLRGSLSALSCRRKKSTLIEVNHIFAPM